jgi:hypothetical protein
VLSKDPRVELTRAITEAQIKVGIDGDDKDEVVWRQEVLTNHSIIFGHSAQSARPSPQNLRHAKRVIMLHKSIKYSKVVHDRHSHEIKKREQNRAVSSRGASRGSGVRRGMDKGMGRLAGRRGRFESTSSPLSSLKDISCQGLNTRIV